jgi:hypothetical protein
MAGRLISVKGQWFPKKRITACHLPKTKDTNKRLMAILAIWSRYITTDMM